MLERRIQSFELNVQRLEQVFDLMGTAAKGKPCAGMKGLLEEGEEVMGEDATEELMDAALIGAAQRVEHYEMAAYGTARTMAEHLGNQDAVGLLQETLDEEKAADEKLTEISLQLLAGLNGNGQNGSGAHASTKPRAKRSRS